MRLILVRHGEAHAGFHGPIAGPSGCRGLTPLGRAQAEALGAHLASTGRIQADVLVASVLPRAIETAGLIAPGLGLEVSEHDCDLCEVHTGEADGVDWSEYNDRFGSFDMEAQPDRAFAPGGESWNGFHRRVHRTLDRLAEQHADRTVVAVCHAGVIMASMRLLLGIARPDISAQLRPTNTGLTEWEHEDGRWTLRSYNEADHLRDLDPGRAGGGGPLDRAPEQREPVGDDDLSTEAARRAAAADDLGAWVDRFLRSPGSDNADLADQLGERPHWWVGPVRLPLDELNRLVGPPGAPALETVDDDEWRDDVDDLAARVEAGEEAPPVIVSHRDDQLVLEDGNHRVEALRRAGRDEAWSIVGFEDEAARDRFLARRERAPG